MSNDTSTATSGRYDAQESLEHFENTRRNLLQKLTSEQGFHQDTKTVRNVIALVDGGARTAIAIQKLEVDRKNADTAEKNADNFADFIRQVPILTPEQARPRDEMPGLPEVIPNPGEVDQGSQELRYAEMMPQRTRPGS